MKKEKNYNIDKDIIDLLFKSFKEAVEENLEVRIDVNNEKYNVSFYQDKIGILQQVSYYYPNTDGRNGYIMLSVKDRKTHQDMGYININFEKLTHVSITYDGFDSTHNTKIITIGDLRIVIKNDRCKES